MSETLYLSRRNLLTLLNKLDRAKLGEPSNCAIVKYRQGSAELQQTMDAVVVIAAENEDFYGAQKRLAGEVHPADDPGL